jgi:hypothetical protein
VSPKPLKALLTSTIAAESTAREGRFDALEERVRRADGIMAAVPPSPPTSRSTGKAKRQAPKRVRTSRRDSFNLPPEDAALLAATLDRALRLGTWTTKSSVVRAALHVLAALPDEELRGALARAHPLKPGRKPQS